MKILVTGAAGFIGYHTCKRLLEDKLEVVGLDNINSYYDPELKLSRLQQLGIDATDLSFGETKLSTQNKDFQFVKINLEDNQNILTLFEKQNFTHIIHLAAQAGVRHSIKEPFSYVNSNLLGFMSIIEACRSFQVKHFIYASSSSVYGLNQLVPFSEKHNTDHPTSLYAATKKSNEMIAHAYSYLFGIPVTGLRFFSVYGPWGRPDMAYFSFTEKILKEQPIDLYNYGKMKRDFTYIGDIVEGIIRILTSPPLPLDSLQNIEATPDRSTAPYRIYNIGNNQSVPLEDFVSVLENAIGKKAIKKYLPLQPEDVVETYANIDSIVETVAFKPSTSIKEGMKKFTDWYLDYFETRKK